MARLSLLSADWLQTRWFRTGLTMVLFLLTGVSVAYAYVRFSEPALVIAPPLRTDVSAQFKVDRSPEARLLGADTSGGLAPPNVQLLGVVAGTNGKGSAVITLDGQPSVAKFSGELIANGWSLSQVNPDGIVLSRDGNQHRIPLPGRPSVDGMINPVSGIKPYTPTR